MRPSLWLLPLWLCTAKASTPVVILRCCAQDAGRCKTDVDYHRLPSDFKISDGKPDCGSHQLWPIHHENPDSLELLPGGVLRHYVKRHGQEEAFENDREEHDSVEGAERRYDYPPGTYCVGEILTVEKRLRPRFAAVCAPDIAYARWNGTDFLMRQIIDPIGHSLNIICLLVVAITYFVVPALRDLIGNILTTIALCLITSQAANLVRIFTRFVNHVSFLLADTVRYCFLMATFFWLNTMGYYIWHTFRSRNIFLRVTDGRKYCYYSGYAWGSTATMTAILLFSHFFLDLVQPLNSQSALGWLAVSVFLAAVTLTILVNIYFYLTTSQAISRMSTYGRIHHKMKYSFEMYIKLFLLLSFAWFFLVISRLQYDAVFYCNIVVNMLQGPLFLYICVCGQKRVRFHLRHLCCPNFVCCLCPCCSAQDDEYVPPEWGEELTTIHSTQC